MNEALRTLAWIFLHPVERRLRAPYRMIVLLLVLAVTGVPAMRLAWVAHVTSIVTALALNFAVLVPSILLVSWLVDWRKLSELGVPTTGRAGFGLLWGTALGASLIGGIAALEIAFGWAHYTWVGPAPESLALSLGIFAMVAVHEELLFRGYLLTNLAEGIGGTPATRVRGLVTATLLTSFGFALAHLFNPNPSVLAMTNIGLAGVFLALPFVLRGDLGASIGLHFGWNLMQCWLGMAVSGNAIEGAWLRRTIEPGQDVWTGGAFGAEGGLLGLLAVVLGTLASIPLARAFRDPRRADAIGLPPAARPGLPKAGPLAPAEAPDLGG
jgi:hypothetical protein